MLSYFTSRLRKEGQEQSNESPRSPVLNEEDETFLKKITSDEQPPPLPKRPTVILDNGKQVKEKETKSAVLEGADQIPLPKTPSVEESAQESMDKGKAKAEKEVEEKKRRNYWSYIPSVPRINFPKNQSREQAASELQVVAEAIKEGKDLNADGSEREKEKKDLISILDGLHLEAVNNRVFSFTKESQKLMEDFNQILKDIVNGVPTAYDDLEKLLSKSEGQLQKMYGNMPPFLQTLVKSLPAKMTPTLTPEIMAAMSEKPGADAKKMETKPNGSRGKKKTKRRVPHLKDVVKQQGVVAGMLRSILNFLKMRFPALMTGTNILMSLAVFLLLFVFWYCHKRGRETRLEKERLAVETDSDVADDTTSELEESEILEKPSTGIESPITIHSNPSGNDKSSTRACDISSVIDQPKPKEVSLTSKDIVEKERGVILVFRTWRQDELI